MHKWQFFKSARCVQAKVETGDDLLALKELDKKLWTVLSAPTKGVRFDAATLRLMDSDGDGRVRVPEVLAAVDWMSARFRKLDFLFAGKDEIPLDEVRDDTPEGKALLASFKKLLARAGKPDATSLSQADSKGMTDVFNAQPLNGDGVVTAKSTSDPAVADAIAAIAAAEGSVTDRSGDEGIDQGRADAFFADAAARLAWKAAAKDSAVFGERTADAYAAFKAVEAKIDEFFTPPEDMPLVTDAPDPALPLTAGVHPLWLGRFRAFADAVVAPATQIARDEWAAVKAKFAPYEAWLAAEAGKPVAGIADDALAAFVKDGKAQAAVNDLIAKDLALADEYGRFVDCERAVRYAANLVDWLRNYVNQENLYDPKRDGVFRTGDLYIDGRVCRLCFEVADEGSHSALAERSRCCLLYAKLSRPATGEAREVCAVVTAGPTAGLYVGRNGIFIDCDGKDWEAVVAKVVEAQVSLREAFWAPWAKIAATISEQCKKFLSSKQDAAVAQVGDKATAAAAPKADAPNGAVLASSVAAIGIGIGMVGTAVGGLVSLVAGLPWWQSLLGVAVVILAVSLPSVILAWFRLRARDLGAILNAGGWAVNRPLTFSMGLARTFTHPAKMPLGSAIARDPYASYGWLKLLALLLALAGAAPGACWKLGVCPFGGCKEQAAP
ncbi:MAG: hypothetical protein IJ658_01980, partial [Kiritimatiellae bacterium]|nr:hypothetical protein [Kiritimatiellia bacterium]